jgi:ABC-2 type transport system permease protein
MSRVRKKSFLIMTILGPILLVGGIILMAYLLQEPDNLQKVMVVDEKVPAFKDLQNTGNIHFSYTPLDIAKAREVFNASDYSALLYIPRNIEHSNTAQLYCKKQPPQAVIRYIEDAVESVVESLKIAQYKIDEKAFYDVKTNFALIPIKYSSSGVEEEIDMGKSVMGFMFGLLIYMFIFIYGVQVMRGVIEEKTSRIIEVIITSVKPFQLMMGKIVGIGLVSLTQFSLWILLSLGLFAVAGSSVQGLKTPQVAAQQFQATDEVEQQIRQEMQFKSSGVLKAQNILERTNWTLMITLFLFYFIGGYLLYAALFAAIGSMVDSESDTQQFMWPVTLPLIFAYAASVSIMENPEGNVAFWFSMIPLTSPIVMIVRVAMGVGDAGIPVWEVVLSMAFLVLGFLMTVWLAARIYRTGILMYGKKTTYKEVWKWIKFNNT